jgi:hypothetical protein
MVSEQADRGDRLHRFAETHLVGEHCFVAGIEEGDAVKLKWERRVSEAERLGVEQRFERRLQQHSQAVGEFHHVARRANAGGGTRCGLWLCRGTAGRASSGTLQSVQGGAWLGAYRGRLL